MLGAAREQRVDVRGVRRVAAYGQRTARPRRELELLQRRAARGREHRVALRDEPVDEREPESGPDTDDDGVSRGSASEARARGSTGPRSAARSFRFGHEDPPIELEARVSTPTGPTSAGRRSANRVCSLERVREREHVAVAPAPADDLQTDRQAARREPARHRDRGQARAAHGVARRHPVDVGAIRRCSISRTHSTSTGNGSTCETGSSRNS